MKKYVNTRWRLKLIFQKTLKLDKFFTNQIFIFYLRRNIQNEHTSNMVPSPPTPSTKYCESCDSNHPSSSRHCKYVFKNGKKTFYENRAFTTFHKKTISTTLIRVGTWVWEPLNHNVPTQTRCFIFSHAH